MIVAVDSESIKKYWRRIMELYVKSFSEPPWFEVIAIEEAEDWFQEMLSLANGISLVFLENEEVVGGTFAFPLEGKKDVAEYVKDMTHEKIIYLAEIFVQKKCRLQGVATSLQTKLLEIAVEKGFTHAVVRTNFGSKSYPMIMKSNFILIGEQEVISLKEVENTKLEIPDRRGIFMKKL